MKTAPNKEEKARKANRNYALTTSIAVPLVLVFFAYYFHLSGNRPAFWATLTGLLGLISTGTYFGIKFPSQTLKFLAATGRLLERISSDEGKTQESKTSVKKGNAATSQVQGDHNTTIINQFHAPRRDAAPRSADTSRRNVRSTVHVENLALAPSIPNNLQDPEPADEEEDSKPDRDHDSFLLEPDEEEPFHFDLSPGQYLYAEMDADEPVDFLLVRQADYQRSKRSGAYTYQKGGEDRTHSTFTYRAKDHEQWVVIVSNGGEQDAEVEVSFRVSTNP